MWTRPLPVYAKCSHEAWSTREHLLWSANTMLQPHLALQNHQMKPFHKINQPHCKYDRYLHKTYTSAFIIISTRNQAKHYLLWAYYWQNHLICVIYSSAGADHQHHSSAGEKWHSAINYKHYLRRAYYWQNHLICIIYSSAGVDC